MVCQEHIRWSMDRWTYACLAMGLLLLAVPAGALIPDHIEVWTDTAWMTAGGGDTATVTAQIKNSTSGNTSFEGVGVDFVVNNTLGSISPAHAETGSDGRATAVFKPGTVAGDARITARMALNESQNDNATLHIDHAASPYQINNTWSSPKVTAGGETKIIVRMEDQYGNVVDSKREIDLNIPFNKIDNATFMVGSPGGDAKFDNGEDKITVPVDENGNATATLRVGKVAGENIVYIRPPKPAVGQYVTIHGMADGVPTSITCTPNPRSGSVPANGKDTITLMYELTDAYGNPAVGQGLWVNSSGAQDENRLINSSYLGQVWITYGPEEEVGTVTLNATVKANPSVTNTTKVEFTSTDPVQMLLSASPQTMASRDVKPDIVSELRAKVMDVRGNPVAGERVTFEIVSNRSAPYNQTVDQVLEAEFAITNSDGSAIVKFRPGAFTNVREAPGWDAAANGTATVRATWENVTRDIDLTWMNYPYLSVETEVSRATVSVNSTDGVSNTTDVTIRLKGDGWALQPDPIDVVLVMDTSGSMSRNDVNPTRMAAAQAAAKNFVDNMSLAIEARDRVALVSFAFNAELKQGLTRDSDEIKGAIDRLSPDGATNMRLAYYTAIKYLKENGRPEAVKAVILMGDGDWNYHGSPLAKGVGYADNNQYLTSDYYDSYSAPLSGYRWSGNDYNFSSEKYEWYSSLPDPKGDANVWRQLGQEKWYDTVKKEWINKYSPSSLTCDNGQFTNQNMSVYANSGDDTDKVRVYSIGFASKLDSSVEEDLGVLSKATGGKYVWAGNEGELRKVYADIAGELKTEAGVGTTMTVFENVEVKGKPPIPAPDVFEYVPKPGISTHILNKTETDVLYNDTINQINDWERDKQLHFDIGTIRLNQNWTTTFRIAVKPSYEADGDDNNINIFGPGATLSFNNGIDTLPLPATFITVYPDLTHTGIISASLGVNFIGPDSGSGPYTDVVPLTWNTTYNGTQDVGISLAWSRYEDGRQPSTFFTRTLPAGTFADVERVTNSTLMDARGLAPGRYWMTVTASARDAKTNESTTDVWVHTGDTPSAFIKIG
ncbi:VWA domain-containing protein [Methanoculleus sp. 10]|uniref:VWA domain-containing protein n=1 Tax=Methanoculleus sp. 10 TaxID=430615 RepID=UPI0025E04D32|nr:VWA domain-containing protein [Methanoculleus sp. 10]